MNGSMPRPAKDIVDIQFRHMIIDFEHQAKAVALASKLALILLRTIPCQRAFERHRNVRCQRTEQFDIFREKFLPALLCHYENAVSLLRRGDWKNIGASADRLGRKWSQLRMFHHLLRYVREENWLLFVKHSRCRANARDAWYQSYGGRVCFSIELQNMQTVLRRHSARRGAPWIAQVLDRTPRMLCRTAFMVGDRRFYSMHRAVRDIGHLWPFSHL